VARMAISASVVPGPTTVGTVIASSVFEPVGRFRVLKPTQWVREVHGEWSAVINVSKFAVLASAGTRRPRPVPANSHASTEWRAARGLGKSIA